MANNALDIMNGNLVVIFHLGHTLLVALLSLLKPAFGLNETIFQRSYRHLVRGFCVERTWSSWDVS